MFCVKAILPYNKMKNTIFSKNIQLLSMQFDVSWTFLKNCFPCGIPLVNFLISRKTCFFLTTVLRKSSFLSFFFGNIVFLRTTAIVDLKIKNNFISFLLYTESWKKRNNAKSSKMTQMGMLLKKGLSLALTRNFEVVFQFLMIFKKYHFFDLRRTINEKIQKNMFFSSKNSKWPWAWKGT